MFEAATHIHVLSRHLGILPSVGHCQASIRNPCCFLQQGFSFTRTLNSHKFEAAPGIHALTRHLGILPSVGHCQCRLGAGLVSAAPDWFAGLGFAFRLP